MKNIQQRISVRICAAPLARWKRAGLSTVVQTLAGMPTKVFMKLVRTYSLCLTPFFSSDDRVIGR